MSVRPPKPPVANSAAGKYHRAIWDWIHSIMPIQGPGIRLRETGRGTVIESTGGSGKAGKAASLQFKGQWSADTAYDEDDIVIRALDDEITDGNLIGTYIANQDIGSGAQSAAGEVPSFPLHANSKWDLFAIVPNTRFTLRSGNQTIEIVSGDSQGTTTAKLSLNNDRTADIETGPRVILDLGDCEQDVIRVRRVPLCEVDVNTGLPTPGYRLFSCGPFHAT